MVTDMDAELEEMLRGEVDYLFKWVSSFAEQARLALDEHPEVRQRALWMLDAMARNWEAEMAMADAIMARLDGEGDHGDDPLGS